MAACIGHVKPMSQVCGQGLGIAVDMTHPRLTGDESKINSTSCRIFPIKLGIMSDQNQECPIKVSFPRDNVRSKFFPYIPLWYVGCHSSVGLKCCNGVKTSGTLLVVGSSLSDGSFGVISLGKKLTFVSLDSGV